MKKFPKTLTATPGVESELDPSMIVVCFKNPMDMDEVRNLAKEMALTLFSGAKQGDNLRWNQVNHTDTRFWLKTEDGKPLDDARLDEIEKSLGDRAAWIGPVYENYSKKGGENCFCPVPNVVLIPKRKGAAIVSIAKMAKQFGLNFDENRSKYLSSFYYLQVPEGSKSGNAFDLKNKLAASGQEVYFENMPMLKPLTATTPNDPLWPNQWDMVQINAPIGWDINRGSSRVVICILDEGCDLDHPDLKFSEQGINLGTMMPPGSPTGPHGTACAGIAAATMNNNAGIAGVAGECLIMPLAFQNWTDIECAIGINYATANGATVISMSFGVYDGWGWNYAIIDPEIQYAFDNNVVMVAASGNEDYGVNNRYPGRHPLVLCIGGSSFDDNRKSPNSPDGEGWGANYGEEYYNGVLTGLSVVAPCVLCPTTDMLGWGGYSGDDYMPNFNGTSSATPHVAGLVGLLRSQNPALTGVQVREIIEKSAVKVGVLPYEIREGYPNGTRNQEMGYGRIDVFAALSYSNTGGTSNCGDLKDSARLELLQLASNKFNHIASLGSCPDFEVFMNAGNGPNGYQSLKVTPCFYLHWGDGKRDVIETEDFEVVVLSACNPYGNVEFKGVTISEIEIMHADGTPVELLPDKTPAAMIVPSRLISFNSIAPSSCSSIELVLKTSGAIEGPYKITLNCCIDEIHLQSIEGDRVEFGIELVTS